MRKTNRPPSNQDGQGVEDDPVGSARFELTDKSIDFLGFRLLDICWVSRPQQFRPSRDDPLRHRGRKRISLRKNTNSVTR